MKFASSTYDATANDKSVVRDAAILERRRRESYAGKGLG